MDIDLVYLWVNGNDPQWQAKRNALIGKTEEKSSANCEGRYANNDELKYSLRSIELYAPWIRKIFIVTDNQIPEWLDTSNPKVKIIDHKDIMPPQALPCFNSNVIEHFIYRIPELSEHYLYANDDMFLNKPTTPSTFFTSEGYPIIRFNRRPFRKLTLLFKEKVLKKQLSQYVQAIRNSANLVDKKYGIYYGGKTHHNIDSYRKSDCEYTRKVFNTEIESTISNHVRKSNDIQRNIYSYVPLAEKRAQLHYVTRKTSFRFHIQNESHYEKLGKTNPLFFCMNDSEHAKDSDRKRASAFLVKHFPNKSQFEK